MTECSAKNIAKRLTVSMLAIILLTAALSVTAFVLVVSTIQSDGHLFHTGNVRLNLNDGKPVIQNSECLFEPGKTVEKEFTLENLSTCAVWYKFYFEQVSGAMAEQIFVQIKDGDVVVLEGKMADLTDEKTSACQASLEVLEKKTFTICFHFIKESGNELQGALLQFNFGAKAVQVRNNPDKNFD